MQRFFESTSARAPYEKVWMELTVLIDSRRDNTQHLLIVKCVLFEYVWMFLVLSLKITKSYWLYLF